ncbi:MAG: RhuM family protein [Phascolarctobacterium faecium]
MTDNNVIVFKDNELELEVNVAPEEDTVWLTQAQMVKLFQSSKANISEHIKNIYDSGELYKEETVRISEQFELREKEVKRNLDYYNLDMIISVGYRVNSKRGIRFRKWATNILKQYVMDGVAVNEKNWLP